MVVVIELKLVVGLNVLALVFNDCIFGKGTVYKMNVRHHRCVKTWGFAGV